jgi:tetratricopeptide (TPR) repeat protein/predicted Ser/Thr protein kinase
MISTQVAEVVGSYEILRLLGQGAFGVVYEARHRQTGEYVALKRLVRVGPASLSSFKREFRSVQGVHHPNLVDLRELFEFDGSCFIAMERVDGIDFLEYVRRDGLRFDETRLRDGLRQLCEALMTLHAAGVVHRDVKPRNVLVTPAGRVVLLDFGHIGLLDDAVAGPESAMLGSAAYMAPEQVFGAPPGPSADYYALGVCLYEALTGTTPFAESTPFATMTAKQRSSAPPLSRHGSALPEDLCVLCERLLDRAASNRASGLQILQVLEGAPSTQLGKQAQSVEFSGRDEELRLLEEEYALSLKGSTRIALVEGDSGIGKSALVAELLRRIRGATSNALVLRNRCYENDQLAYKAFDDGIEVLSAELASLERSACEALMPERVALLPRLFGAFATVPSIAEAPSRSLPADPVAQRLAGFTAFVTLLSAVSRWRPLVVEIDDLQWADAESFRLLRTIIEHDASCRMLIVATVRPREELSEEAAAALSRVESLPSTFKVELTGLGEPDAAALATGLLGARATEALVIDIVRESKGHPLFLSELVRHTEDRPLASKTHLTLDEALEARLATLETEARALLTAVAVGGQPYCATLFSRMLDRDTTDVHRIATGLLAAKLLRKRGADELSCFHDRIRRITVESLDAEAVASWHRRCAVALLAEPVADIAEVARHHDASGDLALAIAAYQRAGEQRLGTLAFDRAEELFRRGLELSEASDGHVATRIALHVGRGHALARGGRSAEAAEEYFAAALRETGEAKTRLRIWGVQHLLQSAQAERGLSAAKELLEELGVDLVPSGGGTIAHRLWDRVRASASGLGMRRSRVAARSRERMQLDALWGLTMPVGWLDPLTSAAMNTKHLRMAHAFGDPMYVAHALGEEAFLRGVMRPDAPEVDALLARARALSDSIGDPALDVHVTFREATAAFFRWDLSRARERLERAQRVGTEACPDEPWLLANVRATLAVVWTNLGEHARLSTFCNAWVTEAQDRNDRFALTMIEGLGSGTFRHLIHGQIEEARATLRAVLAPWPREPFSFAHLGEMLGASYIERYAGGDQAYRWFEREGKRLSSASLLRSDHGRTTYLLVRGLSTLSACGGASSARVREMLGSAREDADQLRLIRSRFAAISTAVIDAQVAALEGRHEEALEATRRACAVAEPTGDALSRAQQYLAGILEGGDNGSADRRAAYDFFAGQGWTRPDRAIAMFCPAIDGLEVNR